MSLAIKIKTNTTKKQKVHRGFFDALQHREYVAGLAVSEDTLVYALSQNGKNGEVVDTVSEVSLPAGIVKEGMLRDENGFADALENLLRSVSGTRTTSVVLSLPPENTWLVSLEFPGGMDQSVVKEAVNLYIEFSLPFPKEEAYADWEIIEDQNRPGVQRVALGAIRKSVIDPYLRGLQKAGMTAVAVETHAIGAARYFGEKGGTFFSIVYPSGAHLAAFDGKLPRFQKFIPFERMKMKEGAKNFPEALNEEIHNVRHFLKTEPHAPFEIKTSELLASKEFRAAFFKNTKEVEGDIPFEHNEDEDETSMSEPMRLIALGAAQRGMLARKSDTMMSFTEVGTEEIYEWKRAVSFSEFFEKLALGVGLFFLVLFLGAYVFISGLSQRAESRQAAQTANSADLAVMQKEAEKFNLALAQITKIDARSPHWEKLFVATAKIGNPGITVLSLSVNDPTSVGITGIAKNRDALLQFKASIAASGIFQEITVPFALIVSKESVPFRFTIPFRDKNFLFQE